MYPDSSHAAFYQHGKAFLGHLKIFLSDRNSGGTGPGFYRRLLSCRKDRKSFDKSEEIA